MQRKQKHKKQRKQSKRESRLAERERERERERAEQRETFWLERFFCESERYIDSVCVCVRHRERERERERERGTVRTQIGRKKNTDFLLTVACKSERYRDSEDTRSCVVFLYFSCKSERISENPILEHTHTHT